MFSNKEHLSHRGLSAKYKVTYLTLYAYSLISTAEYH